MKKGAIEVEKLAMWGLILVVFVVALVFGPPLIKKGYTKTEEISSPFVDRTKEIKLEWDLLTDADKAALDTSQKAELLLKAAQRAYERAVSETLDKAAKIDYLEKALSHLRELFSLSGLSSSIKAEAKLLEEKVSSELNKLKEEKLIGELVAKKDPSKITEEIAKNEKSVKASILKKEKFFLENTDVSKMPEAIAKFSKDNVEDAKDGILRAYNRFALALIYYEAWEKLNKKDYGNEALRQLSEIYFMADELDTSHMDLVANSYALRGNIYYNLGQNKAPVVEFYKEAAKRIEVGALVYNPMHSAMTANSKAMSVQGTAPLKIFLTLHASFKNEKDESGFTTVDVKPGAFTVDGVRIADRRLLEDVGLTKDVYKSKKTGSEFIRGILIKFNFDAYKKEGEAKYLLGDDSPVWIDLEVRDSLFNIPICAYNGDKKAISYSSAKELSKDKSNKIFGACAPGVDVYALNAGVSEGRHYLNADLRIDMFEAP